MSDALIASLQQRISELTAENATIKAEAKDRRIKGKKLAEELEQLRAERETLAKERDTLDAKVKAAPSELQGRIDELTGQIRTRDHRDAFGQVKEFEAAGKKYRLNDGVSIDDVWQLTGYRPEGETPEGKTVSEQFGKALQARPYLFAEATAAGAATRPVTVSSREAGPGPGKSGTDTATHGVSGPDAANRIPGRL